MLKGSDAGYFEPIPDNFHTFTRENCGYTYLYFLEHEMHRRMHHLLHRDEKNPGDVFRIEVNGVAYVLLNLEDKICKPPPGAAT